MAWVSLSLDSSDLRSSGGTLGFAASTVALGLTCDAIAAGFAGVASAGPGLAVFATFAAGAVALGTVEGVAGSGTAGLTTGVLGPVGGAGAGDCFTVVHPAPSSRAQSTATAVV